MARKGGQNKNKSSDSVQLNSDSKKHDKAKRNKPKPSTDSDSVSETLNSPNPTEPISTNPKEETHSPNSPRKTLNPSETLQNDHKSHKTAQIPMQIKLYMIWALAELKLWSDKLKPHIIKGCNCINEKFEVFFPKMHIWAVKGCNHINEKFEGVLPKMRVWALKFEGFLPKMHIWAVKVRNCINKMFEGVLPKMRVWAIKGRNVINEKFEEVLPKIRVLALKFEGFWPKIRVFAVQLGKLGYILLVAWLDCSVRGLDSLLRISTASLFVLIWCSFLSLGAMVGVKLTLLLMVIGGCIGGFLSLVLALIFAAICSIIILWFYGSFWITSLFILFGGVSLALRHEKIAFFVTTIYAMYCVKIYMGWLGLFIGINLSFITSDIVVHLLKKMEENRSNPAENTAYMQDQAETFQFRYQKPTDRGPGEASTSERELNSEEEIERLLNCVDHYSVIGLPRFALLDPTWLKKEYRKKAMLVHPDKNLGNEKAAEAFKKLQNAYEVLLDSLKRKTYDDELKGEELLDYFRHFQAAASQKRGNDGIFGFGRGQSEGVDEGPIGELRRVICKKCGNSHIWICTDRSKSRARWCQECKDFHQAKDGDGWVEQLSQPLLFGLVQKVDLPCAYVCADSKIYDATEWFVCQGMRCPTNTHKPSFHINTNVTKPTNSKGSTSNHKNPNNNSNFEEEMMGQMTEEEFLQWVQNSVNAGHFVDPFGAQNDAPAGANKSGGKKKRSKGKKH